MTFLDPRNIARVMGGVVTGRDSCKVPGPGHSPKDLSVSVKCDPAAPDGLVVHSFAGDDPLACKDHIREKMGIKWEPTREPVGRASQPRRKLVATYDYTDAGGELLYQVVRFDPKDFRQRRPDGRGGWIWNLGDRRVVYRWPDLGKYPDATVFACEGEKDADRLASLGYCATTICGDGKWTDDCIEPLKGRDIFVLEDNDIAGRKRALKAATALQAVAASLRIIRLPGLADGGDVSDWLDANPSSTSQLIDICLGTSEWKAAVFPDEISSNTSSYLKLSATPYTWRDPATIARREWLYGYLLIRKFVSATVSPGGVGKSSLIAAEALAAVSGKDLLGISPPHRLRVWLWNLEDPQEETERKVQAAALHFNLTPDDTGDRLYVDSGRDQPLVIATTTRNGSMIARPVVDALIEEIRRREIDVVVIDPFVSSHEVSENDNQAMDLIIKEWGRVGERGNCAVHLVHHTRKSGGVETEVTTESSRGGKALTDGCRVVRAVNRMSKEEGDKAGVENHRLYFRTLNDKANLQPPADKSDWFKLESVDLGNGPMAGLGGDSIGVVTTWQWPDPLAGITGASFDKVAAVIRSGRWRENSQAAAWVGHAVAKALELNIENKADKARIIGMLKAWLAAGSLVVVEGKDESRIVKKYIGVREQP